MKDFPKELLSTATPSLPDITLNGQPVIMTEAVKEIYELVNMANLAKLRKLEESKVPVGTNSFPFSVTTKILVITLNEPFISFTLINDGPGNVQMRVNGGGFLGNEAPILPGQPAVVSFDYPTIKTISLVSTTTASGRIFGKTGKG